MKTTLRLLAQPFFLTLSALLWTTILSAQQFTVAVCSGGPPSTTVASTFGPMNTVATANASNRSAFLYPPAQLSSILNKPIGSVYFHRGSTTGSITPGANFKVYLKLQTGDFTATSVNWSDLINGATLVYNGDPSTIVGSSAGWKEFPLSTPYTFTGGQNLLLLTEYNNPLASSAISWSYEFTGPCVTTTNNNTTRYTNQTTGLPTALGTVNYRRPYIGFDTVPPPCTAPPVAGTLSAPSQLCASENGTVTLTGNSSGAGQTYQLQSSPNGTAFTNVGAAQIIPSFTISQSATTFYRIQVTCSGNTVNSNALQVTTPALITGTFTINANSIASATNFTSFTAAANAIRCGISGPVTLNVVANSGPYNEQFILPNIAGTSSTNRITINGNGNTLSFATTDANRPVVYLNGTDFVTIDSLVVEATGPAGWGIALAGGADSNIVRRCTVNIPFTATNTDQIGIALNGNATATSVSGTNGSGNLIERNTVNGGYYNIYLYGSTTAGVTNTRNTIRNNVLRDAYLYNIFSVYQQNMVVSGNDISRPTRTALSTGGGVFLSTGVLGALVEKNRIHDLNSSAATQTQTLYGIYVSASATSNTQNRIENNLIYNFYNNNGTQYGLWSAGGDSVLFYHNTIVLDDAAATAGLTYGMGVSTTAASGLVFRNNLVMVTRAGSGAKRALYFGVSTVGAIVSNNNAFWFSPSGGSDNHFGQIGATTTTPFTTLSDWKGAANGAFDGASQEGDPSFLNPSTGLYRPQQSAFDNIGAPGLGVTTDITSSSRSATTPDPGAYEFAGNSCSNPATAGQATVSRDTACQSSSFVLSLVGNSSGSGQTYQWQISANGTTWTNLVASPRLTPSLDTFQTGTNFYRAAVRCQAGTTVFSQPVRVVNTAPLNGNYTINDGLGTSGNNFASFADAVTALRCGVSGPVTFNVAPGSGPYNEQVILDTIPGASANRRVRFLGNGATITANPTLSTSVRAVFRLNGTRFVTLDSFNIVTNNATYGWGVHLFSGAQFDSVRACTIDVTAVTSTTESNSIGILLGGTTTSVTGAGSASFNAIVGNTILGGFKGIAIVGSATSVNAKGNVLSGNNISGFYTIGIEIDETDSTNITLNDISRLNRTGSITTFYGVQVNSGCIRTQVTRNRVHDSNTGLATSAAYGLYSLDADAPAGQENVFTNNLLYNLSPSTSSVYGLFNSGSDGNHYIHNTVVLDNGGSGTSVAYGFYQTTQAANLRLVNNILSINRGGTGNRYCIYLNTAATALTSNNNVLWNASTGTNVGLGFWNAQGYATLSGWQGANTPTPYDLASLSVDPQFVDPVNGDFNPGEASINGAGRNEGVTIDILGRARTATPDPGAYEIALSNCSGTPTAGQAISSDTAICASQNFRLNLTNQSVANGIRYQWQRSTDNVNFSNYGASRLNALLDTNQLTTGYYRAAVACNSGASVFSTTVYVRTLPLFAAGTFTINPGAPASATNYQSLTAAANAIRCGITGPVVFNVASGASFNEQLLLNNIPGASAVNTVRFNGNGAQISFSSADAANRAGIRLNGSRHVYIDSFAVNATSNGTAEYGYGVQLLNDADSNTIARCNISVTTNPVTAASTNYAGIVINTVSSGTATATGASLCDGNRILNNVISGGHTGIALLGNSTTSPIFNNQVIGNRITDFYTNGILHNGGVNSIIRGNDISRPSRISVTTFYAINLAAGTLGVRVEKNRLHTPYGAAAANTLGTYGVNINGADGTLAQPNIIANNMVYNFNGGGTQNGFLNTGSAYAYYYYNSVLLDEASPGTSNLTRAFYQTTAADSIRLWGNNFVVTRGGTGNKEVLYFNTATTTFTTRFNNLRLNTPGATNAFIANVGGTATGFANYATLGAWQASAPRRDTGSLSVDPLFVSNTDLHLQNASTIIGAARPIPGIADDIDGESRGLSFTTMGADEKASALPVAWLSFTARAEGNVNRLLWATGSELNNAGFDVQRSADAQGFEKIGRVASQGGNGGRYDFVDANPLVNGSYYRIAQQDANGQLNYSKTVFVPGTKNAWQLTAVYPNPVRSQLTLQISSPAARRATLQVLNAEGAVVLQQAWQLQAGGQQQVLQVGNLAQGSYRIRLMSAEGETLSAAFIKQ